MACSGGPERWEMEFKAQHRAWHHCVQGWQVRGLCVHACGALELLAMEPSVRHIQALHRKHANPIGIRANKATYSIQARARVYKINWRLPML